jgi:hypothetical protein
MYKFEVGDKILDTTTFRVGSIKRRGYNSVYQEGDYTITWDDGKEETVFQDYAERVFKVNTFVKEFNVAGRRINGFENDIFGDMYQMELPMGNNIEPVKQKPQECDHSWVNYVGFNNAFEFCYKCDKKR